MGHIYTDTMPKPKVAKMRAKAGADRSKKANAKAVEEVAAVFNKWLIGDYEAAARAERDKKTPASVHSWLAH